MKSSSKSCENLNSSQTYARVRRRKELGSALQWALLGSFLSYSASGTEFQRGKVCNVPVCVLPSNDTFKRYI